MAKLLQEINRYPDTSFPAGMYIVTKDRIIPEGRGYMDLHWHEELQFTLVTNGGLWLQVDGRDYELAEGEAIFINRNLLHITKKISENGRYVSFNFPDKLLSFFAGSRMEQDYVLPFTDNYAFPVILLQKDGAWQEQILGLLQSLEGLFLKERTWGHEYEISLCIAHIWYALISQVGAGVEKASKSHVRRQERIQQMLSFVHEHYGAPIGLKDIAAAASVSIGECSRCFQRMIRKSPNQYLMGYRIDRAKELLKTSELSVTEIGMNCGFNDSSHFIQCFKRISGVTPGEYRKNIG